MENQEQEQDLTLIERSMDIIINGKDVMIANKSRAEKAIATGHNIIAAIEANGGKLTPELDERCKNYLANCNKAKSEMNDSRKEFTQLLDAIKKEFTTAENSLDVSKSDTVAFELQKARDAYAKQIFEANQERERQALKEKAIKDEKIDIRFNAETQIAAYVNDVIAKTKTVILSEFNKITLETYQVKSDGLKAYTPKFDLEKYMAFKPTIRLNNVTTEDADTIIAEVQFDSQEKLVEQLNAEILAQKQDLVDKLQSKKNELDEEKKRADEIEDAKRKAEEEETERQKKIAEANEADKKRLEAEAEQKRKEDQERADQLKAQQEQADKERKEREAAEAAKIAEDAKKSEQEATLNAEMNKQGAQTINMFETIAEVSETDKSPEVRQGYEIEILHPGAVLVIVQFWFDKEGKSLSTDKLRKKSIDQMIKFCEDYAHKHDEKIENKLLAYNPTFKAVNRATKK